MRENCKGNMNKSILKSPLLQPPTPPPPPPHIRSILDKERGRTLERTFSLKEPSAIATTHLEIKGV